MKKSKQVFLLCLAMIFPLMACTEKIEPDALGQSDADMLVASSSNWGLLNDQDDFLDSQHYELKYNGDLLYEEYYNLSGKQNVQNVKISEEDLLEIYKILETDFQRTRENYNAYDGTGWSFTYYDPEGEEIHAFKGYIYGSEKEAIIDILDQYLK